MPERSGIRERQLAALEAEKTKQKTYWPAWRYGPNGQAEIFQFEDEVPDGWEDHPSKVGKTKDSGKVEFTADGVKDDDDDVEALMKKTHDDLVGILEDANKERDDGEQIEFLGNWPKIKLAKTIVASEVVPDDLHNAE